MPKVSKAEGVDGFVRKTDPEWRPVVVALRNLILETAPRLEESIKHGMPQYGMPTTVVYIMTANDHVNLGFYDGVDLRDPKGLLEGTGKRLRHVKVRSTREASTPALRALVREAVRFRS